MVTKIIKIGLFSITGILGAILILGLSLQALGYGRLSITMPIEHKTVYELQQGASYPPALHAKGNRLVNDQGEIVRLRGVMIPDPSRLDEQGRFNQELIAQIQATGANVIRVPVHPEFWQRDADYLWRYLDPLVGWAGDAGIYVIIDLHFIGNLVTGAGAQMPELDIPAVEFANQFWTLVAPYFSNAPHVLFEIYNEPADITPAEWIVSSTHLVELIRSLGAKQTLIIGGVEYSKDLSWVLDNPLKDANLAYASHIYPSHSESQWAHWFGDVAARNPVLITEWGFLDATKVDGPDYLAGSPQSFGEPLLAYLDELGVGWVACWYDDEWLPPMFAKEHEAMTEYGQWVIEELKP